MAMRGIRLLSFRAPVRALGRGFSFNGSAGRASSSRLLALAAAGCGAASVAYLLHENDRRSADSKVLPAALAASKIEPQPNVHSPTKKHALYLWIHVKSDADAKKIAKVVADLPKLVDEVVPPEDRDEESEILAGVGFGPEFYSKVASGKTKDYAYPHRKGANGDLPSTGGDVFIHAKSDEMSSLFHLAQVIQRNLKGVVESFKDVYSFVYRNGRDLSGFIDGTENPAAESDRFNVAVDKNTGGSYCITQRWIHDLDYIANEKPSVLESFVGRSLPDSVELKTKPATSHVARMTSGEAFDAKKPFEIVRQSMPYGTVGGEAGLFFIGFAEDPKNFEYMLDRMVGTSDDKLNDNIMKLSRCVEGTYWYFPSKREIEKLKSAGGWF